MTIINILIKTGICFDGGHAGGAVMHEPACH